MQKSILRSYKYFIVRHFIASVLSLLVFVILKAWNDWITCVLILCFMVPNMLNLILFFVDLCIGPQKKRMHYKKMEYISLIWMQWMPNYGHRYRNPDPDNYINNKWINGKIQLYQKSTKKLISLRIITSGKDIKKYSQKGAIIVSYYKYSRIIKEIIC